MYVVCIHKSYLISCCKGNSFPPYMQTNLKNNFLPREEICPRVNSFVDKPDQKTHWYSSRHWSTKDIVLRDVARRLCLRAILCRRTFRSGPDGKVIPILSTKVCSQSAERVLQSKQKSPEQRARGIPTSNLNNMEL